MLGAYISEGINWKAMAYSPNFILQKVTLAENCSTSSIAGDVLASVCYGWQKKNQPIFGWFLR
jgi:hypothetical protein